MAKVRVTRLGLHVLADSVASGARVSKFGGHVLADNPAVNARVSRFSGHVLANGVDNPPDAVVTRFAGHVLGDMPSVNTRVSRFSGHVLAEVLKDPIRLTRLSLQVLGDFFPTIESYDLPPVLDFFAQHWAASVSMTTRFDVQVTKSQTSLAEERRGLAGNKPHRMIRIRWRGLEQDVASRILANLMRISDGRTVVPLYQHSVQTTQASSGGTIHIPTDFGRFFSNARVFIYERTKDGHRPGNYEIPEVAAKQADFLSLKGNLTNTYPTGSVVAPAILVEPKLGAALSYFNDATGELVVTLEEVYGGSTLPSIQQGLPDGFATYQGLPVFDLPHNWRKNLDRSVVREGDSSKHGRTDHYYLQGPRPQLAEEILFEGKSKAESFRALRFLESREGRLLSFFAGSEATDWKVIAASTLSINVTATGDFQNLEDYVDFVAIRQKDGTFDIREIDTKTDLGGGVWAISWTTAIVGLTADKIVKASIGIKARLDQDSFTEQWRNGELMSVNVPIVEVLSEKTVDVPNLAPGRPLYSDILTVQQKVLHPQVSTL